MTEESRGSRGSVSATELSRWVNEAKGMVGALGAEALRLEERAKMLRRQAKQIERALLPATRSKPAWRCSECGSAGKHKKGCWKAPGGAEGVGS